jgi:hypothetical protein
MDNLKRQWSLFRSDERGGMVAGVAKAAFAVTVLSVLAANVVSRQIESSDRAALATLAGAASTGRQVDAMATGSLARQANQTQIDPCALPPRR